MKLFRISFALILAFAIYSVAASVITHTNPLTPIATAMLAGASLLLLDHLEAEHNRRIREERARTWARREREGFGL